MPQHISIQGQHTNSHSNMNSNSNSLSQTLLEEFANELLCKNRKRINDFKRQYNFLDRFNFLDTDANVTFHYIRWCFDNEFADILEERFFKDNDWGEMHGRTFISQSKKKKCIDYILSPQFGIDMEEHPSPIITPSHLLPHHTPNN